MRDLVIVLMVAVASLMALKRPWIGIMAWTWVSIMSPHRFCYGFAFSAPLAVMSGGATLVGLVLTKERDSPFKGPAVKWLCALMFWMTLSLLFAPDYFDENYVNWNKIVKIDAMFLVALAILRTKVHIIALAWVATMSVALLGAKGGVFTVITGGSYKVFGPPSSFIEDNNHFATALVMAVPMVRFLQMQVHAKLGRLLLGLIMLLCTAAALGSYSRGAFLALGGMAVVLWWRGKNRLVGALVFPLAAVALTSLMPDAWFERMNSIKSHDEDASALGRINAWVMAWNSAFHHPTGLGFVTWRRAYFSLYAPHPDDTHAAHSIYFQMLGSHGFVGLILFLGIWFSTWRSADWLRKHAANIPQAQWAADMGSLFQVALVGYALGGAFLSLGYFDLPYEIMVMVVLARVWVEKRGWERESPFEMPKWLRRRSPQGKARPGLG